ncbi:MAG: cation:proton antiporter [Bdellovibrionales bacterium]
MILIALLCGVITTKLGTYYLVGAFIVGMTAGRFKHFIEHEKSQNVLYSVSFFFSFFVPFYFYRAGLTFPTEILSWEGFGVGVVFLLIFLPIRLAEVMSTIWLFIRGNLEDSLTISIPLLPTLIFGLVIATVLREQFEVSGYLVSGLIVYTIGSSIIPWFFLKKVSPEAYDSSMIK